MEIIFPIRDNSFGIIESGIIQDQYKTRTTGYRYSLSEKGVCNAGNYINHIYIFSCQINKFHYQAFRIFKTAESIIWSLLQYGSNCNAVPFVISGPIYSLYEMSNKKFLLQQAYVAAFTNKRLFIANNFPLRDNLFELIRRRIIKEQHKARLAHSNLSEIGVHLTDCLLQEKDVMAFKNFLKLCEEKNKELADNTRREIDLQRAKVDLPPADESSTNRTGLDNA